MLFLFCCGSELKIEASEKKVSKPLRLQAETLTPKQIQAYYLRILSSFVGWIETNKKFIASDKLEPDSGYFDAVGPGVTWPRGNSCVCVVYATLLSAYPKAHFFTDFKIPRKQLQDHLRKSIRAVCLANKNCTRHKSGQLDWGGPSWQAALELEGVTWAALLQEKNLDSDTLALVKDVVTKEADNLDKPIETWSKDNNSCSDSCSWNTPLLALAANMYSDDPRAKKWDYLAKKWAINTFGRTIDHLSSKIIDRHPLKEWVVEHNLYPDLTLQHHGFWSTPYQFSRRDFSDGALAYKIFGRSVPEAYTFHAEDMWKRVEGVLSLWDGDVFFPQGQDWIWKNYAETAYFAAQSTVCKNAAASAFESRAAQMLCRETEAGGGMLGPVDRKDELFGYYCNTFKCAAMAYLMHQYYPNTKSESYDEAEKDILGVHIYPYMKTAIHRTHKKIVSVSWHQRSHAIFVLPEGNSTFCKPPFFCPYLINSGVTQVTFPKLGKQQISAVCCEPKITSDENSMRVDYALKWRDMLTQYITVLSLPDEATVYISSFHANKDIVVDLDPSFPIKMGQIPGFDKDDSFHRGTNWINFAGHLAFISPSTLPKQMPENEFVLTDKQELSVKAGDWFAPRAVVVYVRQPYKLTEKLSGKVTLTDSSKPGKLILSMISSEKESKIETDFAKLDIR